MTDILTHRCTHAPPSRVPPGRVAIVVSTHKESYPLDRCLASLRELLEDPADVVFVDNGSGGSLTEWARREFPEMTALTRPQNGFFCGGYNTGLAHSLDRDYEFALIVNADTEVAYGQFLNELLRAAERHPRGAFFGPQVFLRDVENVQNTVLVFPNFRRYLSSWLGHRLFVPRRIRSDGQEKRVEFLNGVCVLCRVNALRDVGLMDEVMGGYVEDTDWSWRARALGWHSIYVPVPSILHHQADIGYEHYSLKVFMLRRNRVYWHIKCGRRLEARLYATAALLLAKLRRFRTRRDLAVAEQYDYYIERFQNVSRRMLAGEKLGEWFGPPLGPWELPNPKT